MRTIDRCYLSTLMPDGSPQLTQTWVDTDGTDVLINTVTSHQKVKNIQRDPRVALTVSSTTNPSRDQEILGHVTQVISTGAEAHIEALAQRYLVRLYPRYGGPDQERLVLHISPARSTPWAERNASPCRPGPSWTVQLLRMSGSRHRTCPVNRSTCGVN